MSAVIRALSASVVRPVLVWSGECVSVCTTKDKCRNTIVDVPLLQGLTNSFYC